LQRFVEFFKSSSRQKADILAKKDDVPLRDKYQLKKTSTCHNGVVDLVTAVFQDMNVSDRDRNAFTVFAADHFVPIQRGSTSTLFGSAFGYPVFFEWSTIDEAKLWEIRHKAMQSRFFAKGVSLQKDHAEKEVCSSDAVLSLKQSMLLSEQAKKFAIALAVHEAAISWSPHVRMYLMPAVFYSVYVCITHMMLSHTIFSKISSGYKALVVVSLTAIGAMVYLVAMKMHEMELEDEKIEMVARLGEDYLEGGIEYYEKAGERGKLLRKLIKYGDAYFDKSGDLIPFWFEMKISTYQQMIVKLKKALKDLTHKANTKNSEKC
jgi:hypothetical protein